MEINAEAIKAHDIVVTAIKKKKKKKNILHLSDTLAAKRHNIL